MGFPVTYRYIPLHTVTGARCPLFQEMGFTQQTMLRSARALGIVCHFIYGAEAWETRLQEGTWSQQYYQERFTSLQERRVTVVTVATVVTIGKAGTVGTVGTVYRHGNHRNGDRCDGDRRDGNRCRSAASRCRTSCTTDALAALAVVSTAATTAS